MGENLQDHLEVYVQYASRLPVSVAPGLARWRRPIIGFQWLFLRSGLGATNHFEAGGFVRSNDDADPFLRALNVKGIPHRFSGSRGLYAREEVRLLDWGVRPDR